MELQFLGKETEGGDSPTLYATDRHTYIVQGWKVGDPEILAKLDLREGETCVEIYARLLAHLAADRLSGVAASWASPIVHVTDKGNYVIRGTRVIDPGARTRMHLPDHEDAVEVSEAAIAAMLQEDHLGPDHKRATGHPDPYVRT